MASKPAGELLTQAEFLDQCAIFENVFFRVVRQQAFALAYFVQQGTAGGVVFFVDPQVGRQAVDLVGQQGNLNFHVAGVFLVFAVRFRNLGDFFF